MNSKAMKSNLVQLYDLGAELARLTARLDDAAEVDRDGEARRKRLVDKADAIIAEMVSTYDEAERHRREVERLRAALVAIDRLWGETYDRRLVDCGRNCHDEIRSVHLQTVGESRLITKRALAEPGGATADLRELVKAATTPAEGAADEPEPNWPANEITSVRATVGETYTRPGFTVEDEGTTPPADGWCPNARCGGPVAVADGRCTSCGCKVLDALREVAAEPGGGEGG